MAEDTERAGKSAALRLAEEVQRRPFAAAAIAGGAAAAAAAGYLGARAIARRNGATDGKPVNQVLQNAITASQCNGAPVAARAIDGDPEIGLDGS
jgi:hypothetical protein